MKKYITLALLLLYMLPLQAGVKGQLREGGKYYNDEKYGSALNVYQSILKKNPTDQRALFNTANAFYRLKEYTQAEDFYKKAAQQNGDYTQSASYNLGNAYYKAGDTEKAKKAFAQALLQNPKDKEAAPNLQLLIKQQQQNQNDNQQNQNNQDNSSDNQDQKDQNNQGQQQQPRQEEQKNGQLSQQDADRVMAMAKENEYKPSMNSGGQNDDIVEKDW